MDRKILKEALVGVNGKRDVDLLVSLSKQHYDELENGSGNALKECHFIDSSTALGVNFFLLYENYIQKQLSYLNGIRVHR